MKTKTTLRRERGFLRFVRMQLWVLCIRFRGQEDNLRVFLLHYLSGEWGPSAVGVGRALANSNSPTGEFHRCAMYWRSITGQSVWIMS